MQTDIQRLQQLFRMQFCATVSSVRRRQWHPTPVLLPGKPHGWRSLLGCSPWGRKESDTTERLHFHFSLSCIGEGHGNPLQCSCLENPRDGGAWWAAISGVTQSWTWLKQLGSSNSSVICDEKRRATIQTSLDQFFKKVDRILFSKETEPVPSTSGISEISACPPSPAVEDPCASARLLQSCPYATYVRTVAHPAPLSMGFPMQEYWSGLPYPPPGNLPHPGFEPVSLMSPALWETLQLYHLPLPLPPPVSNSSCLFTGCQSLCASCCTVLLYFSRCCAIRFYMFSLYFVLVFYVSFV